MQEEEQYIKDLEVYIKQPGETPLEKFTVRFEPLFGQMSMIAQEISTQNPSTPAENTLRERHTKNYNKAEMLLNNIKQKLVNEKKAKLDAMQPTAAQPTPAISTPAPTTTAGTTTAISQPQTENEKTLTDAITQTKEFIAALEELDKKEDLNDDEKKKLQDLTQNNRYNYVTYIVPLKDFNKTENRLYEELSELNKKSQPLKERNETKVEIKTDTEVRANRIAQAINSYGNQTIPEQNRVSHLEEAQTYKRVANAFLNRASNTPALKKRIEKVIASFDESIQKLQPQAQPQPRLDRSHNLQAQQQPVLPAQH